MYNVLDCNCLKSGVFVIIICVRFGRLELSRFCIWDNTSDNVLIYSEKKESART